MDPYEKLLSPHRVTRNSSRLRCKEPPSVVTTSTTKPTKPTKGESEPTKGSEYSHALLARSHGHFALFPTETFQISCHWAIGK